MYMGYGGSGSYFNPFMAGRSSQTSRPLDPNYNFPPRSHDGRDSGRVSPRGTRREDDYSYPGWSQSASGYTSRAYGDTYQPRGNRYTGVPNSLRRSDAIRRDDNHRRRPADLSTAAGDIYRQMHDPHAGFSHHYDTLTSGRDYGVSGDRSRYDGYLHDGAQRRASIREVRPRTSYAAEMGYAGRDSYGSADTYGYGGGYSQYDQQPRRYDTHRSHRSSSRRYR